MNLRKFDDEARAAAEAFRLAEQRTALAQGLDREIVLFHAESEEALRRTHGSYFLTPSELVDRTREAAEAS